MRRPIEYGGPARGIGQLPLLRAGASWCLFGFGLWRAPGKLSGNQ